MDIKKLIENAEIATNDSYSPYSKFKVGACLLCKNGNIYTGANVENASYGATICAERNAINKAVLSGDKEFEAIAIMSSSSDYTYPCGICRQVMIEFSPDMKVIVAKNVDDYKIYTASELLPHYFNGDEIK